MANATPIIDLRDSRADVSRAIHAVAGSTDSSTSSVTASTMLSVAPRALSRRFFALPETTKSRFAMLLAGRAAARLWAAAFTLSR